MRIQLESVVEDLWNQFTTALKDYQEATEEKKKAFKTLKVRDERNSEEIETQRRKMQRMGVSRLAINHPVIPIDLRQFFALELEPKFKLGLS